MQTSLIILPLNEQSKSYVIIISEVIQQKSFYSKMYRNQFADQKQLCFQLQAVKMFTHKRFP